MEAAGISDYLQVRTAINPIYHPEGHELSYIADYTGLPQVWDLNRDGEEPSQSIFTKERIIFVQYIEGTRNRIIGMDASGNEKQQLFLLKPNAELIPLTNSPEHIHHYGGSSPDGNWIAWSSNRRNPEFFDIYIQNLVTLSIHQVYASNGVFSPIQWSPDGKSLLIRKINTQTDHDLGLLFLETRVMDWLTRHSGEAGFKNPHFSKNGEFLYLLTNKDREFYGLAVIDLATKNLTWLEKGNWDFEGLTVSKDKSKLAFSVNEGGISRGVLADMKRSALYTWKTPLGVISDLKFSPDNQRLAYVLNGPAHPSDIWEVDLRSIQAQRLTQHFRSPVLESGLIEPVPVLYKSFDNLTIPAFYYKPKNASGKLPVIVYLHGGPESQSRAVYNPFLQYLLSRGYAVCTPNVRGSTGYGKSFTHLDDVRKRMDSVKDLVSLTEWLKSEGGADPGKIAIVGGSYGGFLVLAAISHYPDLWAAGIDIVGISSIRNYLESTAPWRRKLREAEYGTIEKDGAFFDNIDPLNFAERIICPLMVVHGANDPRVPIEESERIVKRLKDRNHPVTYLRFEDEGHTFAKRENKKRAYADMAKFVIYNIGI